MTIDGTATQVTPGPIDALLHEERRYPPTPVFAAQANWNDPSIYTRAAADPQAFWGEPGDQRVLTYGALYREVNRAATALRRLGVRKGDRVAIYLGMIPEAIIAMLACARLGAPHTVIFGGFSAEAVADRINDSQAKLLITGDGSWRRGSRFPLKDHADRALQSCLSVEKVLVVNRTDADRHRVPMNEERDVWWDEALAEAGPAALPPEPVDSEHPLFILHTSGTTGRPKGMLHTTGGYLVGAATTHWALFDLKEDDVYWCTAVIGWVTAHSYIAYGPLANGATVLLYEGTPDYPARDRFWDIVEKHGVTILYTAPTAIRTFMKWGTEHPAQHDLSTLRVLGTVGEPINPEAWVWYREVIGSDRCPVVDTWWMTETGQILITPLPGITVLKPGSATFPVPGVKANVLDESGNSVPLGKGGYLVLQRPWPAMARTIWGDPERYKTQYWSRFPGNYFAGDGAKRDDEGYYWLLGRVDDVLNVAGHRIGTMEVESALVSHPAVAEAAVIGRTHELKGQAIAAFVSLRTGRQASPELREELRAHVAEKIGALARPDDLFFTADLPKTRSGKIMRRLLRDIAEGRALGDTTTLADPGVVASLKEQYEEREA